MEPRGEGLLLRWIERRSPAEAAAIVLALVAAVAVADWVSTAEIAFTLGYMLPLALAAWRLPRAAVVLVAVACAGAWLVVHEGRREIPQSTPVLVVNLVMELLVFLSFGLLLAAMRQRLQHERRLARTDSLTGMPNRRAFHAELERETERCRRYRQPFSIAYLDVDQFKQVNDRLGHAAGDALLKRVAMALQSSVRKVDLVARLGGDEFALLLPGADAIGAGVVIRRLQALLAEWVEREFSASCSIGCLTVLRDPPGMDELVAEVDRLMYRQKAEARGTCRHETWPKAAARENSASA